MSVYFGKEQQYLPMVQRAAAKYNLPTALLLAHIRTESNFNPVARLDEKNASGQVWDSSFGMMQLLLGTAKGLDPNATASKLNDPEYNIDLGAQLVRKNLDKYNGNIKDEIASYNAGVARKNEQGQYVNSRGVPNVQKYVDKVYGYYVDYTQWLGHGASLIDVSINPWLIAGFSFVLVLTIIGGGVYVSKRKSNRA